jgi:hypothetical protein
MSLIKVATLLLSIFFLEVPGTEIRKLYKALTLFFIVGALRSNILISVLIKIFKLITLIV